MRARSIDVALLAKVAGDPTIKSEQVARHLGFNRSSFYYTLTRSDALWEVYAEARSKAGFRVNARRRAEQRNPHGILKQEEIAVLEAIASTDRTYGAVRVAALAAGVDPRRFSAVLYSLENEKHEIWSDETGRVTKFYLRGEESEPPAVGGGPTTASKDARAPQAGMPALQQDGRAA
jgi:hypothetical protein